MAIEGYTDYKRREFCKSVKCPVQLDLDACCEDSSEHETIKSTCKTDCRYTTYEFHHWLINKRYEIVRPD